MPLHRGFLRADQVLVLDAKSGNKETLFLWRGPNATRQKVCKGIALVQTLKDCDYLGRPTIIRVSEEPDCAEFWEYFGPEQLDDDNLETNAEPKEVQLLRVEGEGIHARIDRVQTSDGVLHRHMVTSNYVYLLDCEDELFIWVGRLVSDKMRNESLKHGSAYLFYSFRSHIPLKRMVEGTEDAVFKHQFHIWEFPAEFDFTPKGSTGIAAPLSPRVDIESLTRPKLMRAPSVPLEGEVTISRVEKFELSKVPDHLYGALSESC